MKNGLNFDASIFEGYEQWRQDRSNNLTTTVITVFIETANKTDEAAVFVHDFIRELLLASGFDEEGLALWELIEKEISDHAS